MRRRHDSPRAFTLIELVVVVAIVFALLALTVGVKFPGEVVYSLAAGWVYYLGRFGEVEVSLAGVTTALVCLTGLALGLHLFLAWLCGQRQPGWQKRQTAAVLGVLLLALGAGIAAVGVTHQVAWLFNSPEPLLRGGRDVGYRIRSSNNLKEIGIAVHSHDDVNQAFPPGCTFANLGRPLHGWHTFLLPYLEQEQLFKQIDLSQPWNAPANLPATQTVIRSYQRHMEGPTTSDGYPVSHYAGNVRVLGPAGPRRLKDISDGLSNTLLAGEAWGNFKPWGHPVGWRDLALGVQTTPDGFGGPRSGTTVLLLADGSVRTVRGKTPPAVLKALSTPAGGEVVNWGDW